MTDPALANAEKRRDELAAEINKAAQHLDALRKRLAGVESFIKDWHRFAEGWQDSWPATDQDLQKDTGYPQDGIIPSAPSWGQPQAPANPIPVARKNPDKAEVGREAKTIIYGKAKPVPRTELFKELAARGIVIHGKDPEMVLSTMMWRMKEDFVRLPGHGYWIKMLPWKPAKYEPGTPPQQDIEDLEIELNALDAEVEEANENGDGINYRGYQLRPEKTANGWVVNVARGVEPPRRTMEFSSQDLALEEAKTIVQSAAPLRRI
jgi:hypothetical protein